MKTPEFHSRKDSCSQTILSVQAVLQGVIIIVSMLGRLLWLLLGRTLAVKPFFASTEYEVTLGADTQRTVCVVESGQTALLLTAQGTGCLAEGFFKEEIESTGWNRLHVSHQESVLAYYAAGLAEGTLMGPIILSHLHNMFEVYEGDFPALYQYYSQRDSALLDFLVTTPDTALAGLRAQLEGVLDGANLVQAGLTLQDLYFINTDGSIGDLMLIAQNSASFLGASNVYPRCSALIKCVGSELFFGHATMESYLEMNRVIKSYEGPEGAVIMSSYPGAISSTDDFVLTSRGLAVMETSLNVDMSLGYEDEGVFAFFRLQKAARTSTTARQFIKTFLQNDDHTYSSSWMILDFPQYDRDPMQEAFFVLETTAAYAHYEDKSLYLQQTGYWASYNNPALPTTPSVSPDSLRRDQFALLQANITSLSDFQKVLRFNGYNAANCDSTDPLRPCTPAKSISSRADLGEQALLFGATDTKVTSKSLMERTGLWGISGPTTEDLPAFTFSPRTEREYIPTQWDFAWVYADVRTNARVANLS